MTDEGVVVLGIPIPSSSPVFLSIVAVHVVAGLTCTVAGIVAMLSPKRCGRHPSVGTVYYWGLVVVFLSMAALSFLRWPANNHLFILGVLSFSAGTVGRMAKRRLPPGGWAFTWLAWAFRTFLLLTAFYVDNGPHLPIWRSLPPLAHWLLPSIVGLPILMWTITHHPLIRGVRSRSKGRHLTTEPTRTRRLLLALITGAAIGILGGLIGLGGAEFRLPLLITVFGFVALEAVIVNKAISLIVVASALAFRSTTIPIETMLDNGSIVINLLAGSLVGALFGAHLATLLVTTTLYRVIAVLLVLIALVLAFAHDPSSPAEPIAHGAALVTLGLVARIRNRGHCGAAGRCGRRTPHPDSRSPVRRRHQARR